MATFFNQATLTYNDGSASSNIVAGELIEALTVTKTATTETYREGEGITYVIGLVNESDAVSSVLTVSDDLGAYTVDDDTVYPLIYREDSVRLFINGEPAQTPTVISEQPLIITGITVPANSNAILVYTADVSEFASPNPDGSIVNTVTVRGNGITTPITASETVTARGGALLGIEKELSPTQVAPGEPLTYTITVTNNGNEAAVATDDLTVSDTFDPILNITSVTLDGEALTEGADYTYNEATGLFRTTPGVITVPAATYTVDPDTGAYVTTPGTATLVVVGTV